MYFMIAYLIIGIACVVISGRTLVAYSEYSTFVKCAVYLLLLYAWFSPILVWTTQAKSLLSVWGYTVFAKLSYFLFGFAFLLFMILFIRDIGWFILHLISPDKIVGLDNLNVLKSANIVALLLTLFLSSYAVYGAEKMPQILEYSYIDSRIKQPLKVLLISDLHITKMTPVDKVKSWVAYFNDLKPDIILLAGDIADDKTSDIQKQIKALKKLQAKNGMYYVVGNHEVYFNPLAWEGEFASLGWKVLHNSGVEVQNAGLYIAGVPDASALSVNHKQALKNSSPEQYRILLSHAPSVVFDLEKGEADLQVSGHTHGGQLFPFNFLTRFGNKGLLAGEYNINDTKLIISRGAGYWGPPMRLFAPSDVVLINLSGK